MFDELSLEGFIIFFPLRKNMGSADLLLDSDDSELLKSIDIA